MLTESRITFSDWRKWWSSKSVLFMCSEDDTNH